MASHTKRRIHEPGHKRKFLVIADETPECEKAIFFAAFRARNTGSSLTILYVIEPVEFQHWSSVEAIHQQEQERKSTAVFRLYQRKLDRLGVGSLEVEEVVRSGKIEDEVIGLINEDQDIGFLVLGASTSQQGPGRLVNWLGTAAAGRCAAPASCLRHRATATPPPPHPVDSAPRCRRSAAGSRSFWGHADAHGSESQRSTADRC